MPSAPSGSLLGVQIPEPKGPGSFIGRANRMLVMAILRAMVNLQVKVPMVDTAGNYLGTADAAVTLANGRCVVTLPKTLNPASAGGGAGMEARFRFKDDLGSSLRCRTWDGTTEGTTDVFIAKQPTLRATYASAVQNGVTYSFSYSAGSADTNGNHYFSRVTAGSDGTNVTSDIAPPFIFNDDIYAVAIVAETLDENSCAWLDQSPRAWAAIDT